MPDGNDYSELNPRKEAAKFPIKMAAETIPKENGKPNQDSYFVNAQRGIAGVLDGMGGHKGGAEASKIGASMEQTLRSKIPVSVEDAKDNIKTAFAIAQENILYNAQKPGLEGMGTTGTVTQFVDNKDGTYTAVIGSVGDSRAYVFRNGKLEAVTIDDSTFTKGKPYEEAKAIQTRLSNIVINDSAEAAEYFAQRNRIGSALGSEDGINPNIYTVNIRAGDRLILTTDGVHDNLTDRDIEAIMRIHADPEAAAKRLTENAQTISEIGKEGYQRSKRDDITAVVIEAGSASGQKPHATPPELPRQPSVKSSQTKAGEDSRTIQNVREEIKDIREAKPNLFDNAQSAIDVLNVLAGINGLQGSNSHFRSEDLEKAFLDVVSGAQPPTVLTRSEGLRNAAIRIRQASRNGQGTIPEAKTVGELVNVIAGTRGIQGSKDWFSNRQLINILREVLAGKAPLNMLPRAQGLRSKAEELLPQRQRRRM